MCMDLTEKERLEMEKYYTEHYDYYFGNKKFVKGDSMINIRIDFKLQIDEDKFDKWLKIRGVGRNFGRNYIKDQIENNAKKYIKEIDLK
tara:strand:- start:1003 stop:1269 length:267 start_codon:yes stop_codon:yes gene_type:complete